MSPPATTQSPTRPRPPWLRALGRHETPDALTRAGHAYRCVHRYKHDAYAATARYASDEPTDAPAAIVKFGRTAPLLGLPLAWLGAHLCRKEREVHRRLEHVPGVPAALDDLDTQALPRAFRHAFARTYVPGRTLRDVPAHELPDDFFATLAALLDAVHARGVAVMDLQKAENILVDPQGQPHLIDFQLSVRHGHDGDSSRRAWTYLPGATPWFRLLQRCDRFYIAKHFARMQPDRFAQTFVPVHGDLDTLRPPLTRCWRALTKPTRHLRRRLLVRLRIRHGSGTADTETA